jgi:FkbM family methyltransferase
MFRYKYSIANRFAKLIGWPSTLNLFFRKSLRIKKSVKTWVPGIKSPIYVRPTTDDLWVLLQVFDDKEYQFVEQIQAHNILDLGGNSGYTAVYFANIFPDARIITLEPDSDNYYHLLKNVRSYPNIASLHAAIWDKEDFVILSDPSAKSSSKSFQTPGQRSTSGELVSAHTIQSISIFVSVKVWDLIKMDIEGAEDRLLQSAAEWVGYADALAIEIHDCCRDQASINLTKATTGWHSKFKRGETHWCIRHESSSST